MIAELLAFGHSYDAVMTEYCIDELTLHYEAMIRTQAKDQKRRAMTMRAATQADRKGWREFNKHLDNVWKDIELSAGRSISTPGTFFAGLRKVKGRLNRGVNRNGDN